jgi:hypothetical protein
MGLSSVYNVSSSKFPVQGAYVKKDEFCYGMRDLDLSSFHVHVRFNHTYNLYCTLHLLDYIFILYIYNYHLL